MDRIVLPDHADMNALWQAADGAGRALPPAWPLQATVAVNPFLGQAHLSFAETAVLIARLTGKDIAPPRAWFAGRLRDGLITDRDLADALKHNPVPGIETVAALAAAAGEDRPPAKRIPDIASLAARTSGLDCSRLVEERIGAFAAGYFDEGQALWTAAREQGAYTAWRVFAMHDLTPEIAGLSGFASFVSALPLDAEGVIAMIGKALGLGSHPGTYFHQLLLGLGGYAQIARQKQFCADRDGLVPDATLPDLLAIRLAFELALYQHHGDSIKMLWQEALAAHRQPLRPERDHLLDAALLDAAERGAERAQLAHLKTGERPDAAPVCARAQRPALTAAFCIDVRSERIRRALETLDSSISTVGFAGFFGMGVCHRPAASDPSEHRLPVLLRPSRFSCEAVSDDQDRRMRYRERAVRAFGRFRQAAVSSFAFIEAMGPIYAGKLLGASLGLPAPKPAAPRPEFAVPLTREDKVGMAESVLRAMSMTDQFARLVLIAGHASGGVNNPWQSALQCGACGGHGGDVNARLLVGLLNHPETREGLVVRGMAIPSDTLFVAALHDTVSDTVTLFDLEQVGPTHADDLRRLTLWLEQAGRLARAERAADLPRGGERSLAHRGRNWAETRSEWGLAGCTAFIAAPRALTAGERLEGQTFLHDYVWQRDADFRILELILTAPVVVASWINLAYFGAAAAPDLFGSGNKLIHNVTGGMGVVEGNSGLLRTGLPFQSVHDGKNLMHAPLRLSVYVAAPVDAISAILARQPALRQLLDHGWLRLLCLNAGTQEVLRYGAGRQWEEVRE